MLTAQMPALAMESTCLSNRYSVPTFDTSGFVWLPGYEDASCPLRHMPRTSTPPLSAQPSSERQSKIRHRRPLTYHGGFLHSHNNVEEDQCQGFGVEYRYEDIITSQGPTIASIRCEGEPQTSSQSTTTADANVHDLRIDTASTTPHDSTPLTLVSDFLDTLAGLVHTPLSAPFRSQAAEPDQAIMIFDSEVFVDVVVSTPTDDILHKIDIPTASAWSSPSMDWEFLAPFTGACGLADSSCQIDALADIKRERQLMDMTGLMWC